MWAPKRCARASGCSGPSDCLHFFRLGFGKSELNRLPRLPQGPRAARLSHEARACIDTMGTPGPEAKTKPRFFVSLRGAGALSKLERD